MFYFWSSGENGEIWLSGDGIREAFSVEHPEAPRCSDVVLLGERNLLNVTFVLEPGISLSTRIGAEKSFLDFASSLGIDGVQSGWVKEPSTEERLSDKYILKSPLFWGGAAWFTVAVFRMGFSGTFLATAAAVAAFSAVALFTTPQGLEIRKWVRGLLERNA
jgi:hypothetical protein